MKLFDLSKRSISIVALLLAVVMMFSACGGKETTSTDGDNTDAAQTDSVQEQTNQNDNNSDASDTETDNKQDGQQQQNNQQQNNNQQNNQQQNNQQQNNNQQNNQQQNNQQQNNQQQNNQQQNNQQQNNNQQNNQQQKPQQNSKTTWDADYLSTIPADVKSKEIHILMWRQYDEAEQKLVNDFQKKTGMKIRTTITTEQDYSTKLISLISGRDAPDVVMVTTSSFPGIVTKSCAPLDPKVFRLDDSVWYKTYMDCFKVNGKYFSVAMNKTPSCEDTNYVMYYLKSTLKECGISTMPWDLYKQGKWDWAAQKDVITKVSAKGKTGLSMLNTDTYMYSAGVSFVKYDGKQYSNNMSDPNIAKAWREVASINDNTGITGWDYKNIATGNVGLFESITYQGLKASKVFRDANGKPTVQNGIENVNCVPIAGPTQASAYVPVRAKCWANAKGSKNPEGAAYFLRYFLDVKNTDYENLFHNDQIKEVYTTICDKNARKFVTYSEGVINFTNKNMYSTMVTALTKSSSAQIGTTISKYKNTIDAPIRQANFALSKIK